MRIYRFLGTALCIGAVAVWFFDDVRAILIGGLPYVVRSAGTALGWAGMRFVKGRAWILLLIIISAFGANPRWFERKSDELYHFILSLPRRSISWWCSLAMFTKTVMFFVPLLCSLGAIIAGLPLGAIALIALRSPLTAGAIAFSMKSWVPWLAKKSASIWVDKQFKRTWERLPPGFRDKVEKRYRRLWFWTMFRIARGMRTYQRSIYKNKAANLNESALP
jgi:hypothetical protein